MPDARSETVRRRECCLEQCQRRRKPIVCTQCGRKRLTRLAHDIIDLIAKGAPPRCVAALLARADEVIE